MAETKGINSEEAFKGWKDSFMEQYKKFLDPAGVENAEMSNARLLRSLERLASTVITVKKFVDEDKITAETQSVQGMRHLTNMTDQMAETEKEIARFMPTTGAEETAMGYDKFELGAVMIEDGFHVYEHLKTTKDIIQHLQGKVLNDVLQSNKLSIIQFYLRQIQTFCDVMADLGLFGLMERLMEIYQIKPRSKTKPEKPLLPPPPPPSPKKEKKEKPPRVLDPNVNYTRRSAYTGGYFDPFSGTQPGKEEVESSDDEEEDPEGDGEDEDNDFIIYFDMKTGTIGKIPRSVCVKDNFIVSKDDAGNETMQGEIEDDAEKEQLIWDMKKAMKGAAPSTPKTGPKRTRSPKADGLKNIQPPLDGPSRNLNRAKSGDLTRSTLADIDEKSPGALRARKQAPARTKSLPKNNLRTSAPAALLSEGASKIKSLEPVGDDEYDGVLNDGNEEKKATKSARTSRASDATPSTRSSMARGKSPGRLSKSNHSDQSDESKEAPSRRPRPSLGEDGDAGGSKSSGPTRNAPSRTLSSSGQEKTGRSSVSKSVPSRTKSTPLSAMATTRDGQAKRVSAAGRSKSPGPLRDTKTASDGWSKPGDLAAARRTSEQTFDKTPPSSPKASVTKPRPSSSGWASPGVLAAKRRSVQLN